MASSKTPAPSTVTAKKIVETPITPPVAMKPVTETKPVESPKLDSSPGNQGASGISVKTETIGEIVATILALDTSELKKVLASARLELKVRDEALQTRRPKEGQNVKIGPDAPKRWAGKTGTVLLAGKSRVFIKVDGFIQAANVPLAQVSLIEAEG